MPGTIPLEIVTPTQVLYEGAVTMFRAPGSVGLFQVLPRHHPMVSTLEIGRIDFREEDGTEKTAATSGGYVEVLRSGITVLASAAELAEHIDVGRAQEALERAKARLHEPIPGDIDKRAAEQAKVELALLRAVNRLRVAGKL